MLNAGIEKQRNSHVWKRHADDRYVEPEWCTTALFGVEGFQGLIWDPACGIGSVLKAARAAEFSSYGSDISEDAHGTVQDFLTAQAHTATGKLNVVITPIGPKGCHCSIMRCAGRSLAIVRP